MDEEGLVMTFLLYPEVMPQKPGPESRSNESHETSALWLRAARRSAGLTQTQLAERLGVDQSQVARAESGRVELSAANLDRYLRACRFRLVAVPTVRATAVELAGEIRQALKVGESENAVRLLIQLSDNLVSEELSYATTLVTTPADTGDERFNAAIAGIAEWRLSQRGLPIPAWIEKTGALADKWWVDEFGVGEASIVDATPEPLRRRNVVIDQIALESV